MAEQNVPFKKSLFGFSPDKVMNYVDELLKNSDFDQIHIAELEKQLAEKDDLIAQLQKKADAADAAANSQKEICRNCDINKKAQSLLGEAMFDVRRFSEYLVSEAQQKADSTISGAQEKVDIVSEKAKKILFNVDDISSNFSSQIEDLRSALAKLSANLDAFSQNITGPEETQMPESVRNITEARSDGNSPADDESRSIVNSMKAAINSSIPVQQPAAREETEPAQPNKETPAPAAEEIPVPVAEEIPAPVKEEKTEPVKETVSADMPYFTSAAFPPFSFGGDTDGEQVTQFIRPASAVKPAAPVTEEAPVAAVNAEVPAAPVNAEAPVTAVPETHAEEEVRRISPENVTAPVEEQSPVNINRTSGVVMPENGVSPFADLFEATPVAVTFDASQLNVAAPAPAVADSTDTINTNASPFTVHEVFAENSPAQAAPVYEAAPPVNVTEAVPAAPQAAPETVNEVSIPAPQTQQKTVAQQTDAFVPPVFETAAPAEGLPVPPVFTKTPANTSPFTVPDVFTAETELPAFNPPFAGVKNEEPEELPVYNPGISEEDDKKSDSFTFVNMFKLKPNPVIKPEPTTDDPAPVN